MNIIYKTSVMKLVCVGSCHLGKMEHSRRLHCGDSAEDEQSATGENAREILKYDRDRLRLRTGTWRICEKGSHTWW